MIYGVLGLNYTLKNGMGFPKNVDDVHNGRGCRKRHDWIMGNSVR